MLVDSRLRFVDMCLLRATCSVVWLFRVCCMWFAVCCLMLVVSCLMFDVRGPLSVACGVLPGVLPGVWLGVVCCSLCAACCLLCCLLFNVWWSWCVVC